LPVRVNKRALQRQPTQVCKTGSIKLALFVADPHYIHLLLRLLSGRPSRSWIPRRRRVKSASLGLGGAFAFRSPKRDGSPGSRNGGTTQWPFVAEPFQRRLLYFWNGAPGNVRMVVHDYDSTNDHAYTPSACLSPSPLSASMSWVTA
jgi:hypothetical protein